MESKTYMDRLEDLLDKIGLRTFEAPQTVDYRFGEFQPEEGLFRCFVYEDDIERTDGYMELKANKVYWIALEYPDFDTVYQNMMQVSQKTLKNLGRLHTCSFILAVEEISTEESQRIQEAFDAYAKSLSAGTYQSLSIWDDEQVNGMLWRMNELEKIE